MSDEKFGINISKEDASELTRLLLGCVGRLLKMNQYNDFLKLQAIEDPFKFIAEVEKHADTLEKEDESKGFFHLRISDVTKDGENSKIGCIKMIRQLMGWGLADSKASFEALPHGTLGGSRHQKGFTIITRAFSTMESLQESNEWKEFYPNRHLFVYDTPRLPAGTDRSQPAKYPS